MVWVFRHGRTSPHPGLHQIRLDGRLIRGRPPVPRAAARPRPVLGPDHPDILITRGGLAWAIGQPGDWSEAARLYREPLPDAAVPRMTSAVVAAGGPIVPPAECIGVRRPARMPCCAASTGVPGRDERFAMLRLLPMSDGAKRCGDLDAAPSARGPATGTDPGPPPTRPRPGSALMPMKGRREDEFDHRASVRRHIDLPEIRCMRPGRQTKMARGCQVHVVAPGSCPCRRGSALLAGYSAVCPPRRHRFGGSSSRSWEGQSRHACQG